MGHAGIKNCVRYSIYRAVSTEFGNHSGDSKKNRPPDHPILLFDISNTTDVRKAYT